jgi:hypothetical protein
MSASSASTKVFGMKVGADRRKLILLAALAVVAAVLFLYNSGSDVPASQSSSTTARPASLQPATPSGTNARRARRRVQRSNEHNTLRMEEVTVEAARGDIDPTLRLDLLQRLKTVKFTAARRNLFEPGAVITPQMPAAKPVKIVPGPLPHPGGPNAAVVQTGPAPPPPIPLKFYGFAASANGGRRGFFLDQDNIVVADQGDIVKGRYRIVSLEPKSAEVEDMVTHSRQNLTIVPELRPSGF